jgi:hypothetical protein
MPPTDVPQFEAYATYRDTEEDIRHSQSPKDIIYQTEPSALEQESSQQEPTLMANSIAVAVEEKLHNQQLLIGALLNQFHENFTPRDTNKDLTLNMSLGDDGRMSTSRNITIMTDA